MGQLSGGETGSVVQSAGGPTLVTLVHKLEQLVDDRLEKLPMGLEEARVLADNVHDVGRDDSLVVLASLDLDEAEQVLDDLDKKALLGLLVHRARDRADRPAERVEVRPRPLAAVDLVTESSRRGLAFGDHSTHPVGANQTHLLRELFRHDVLSVEDVEVRQVDEDLAHALVKDDRVRLLHKLTDHLALVILDDEDLLWLDHALDHDEPQVRQDLGVDVLPERLAGGEASAAHAAREVETQQRVDLWHGRLRVGGRERASVTA